MANTLAPLPFVRCERPVQSSTLAAVAGTKTAIDNAVNVDHAFVAQFGRVFWQPFDFFALTAHRRPHDRHVCHHGHIPWPYAGCVAPFEELNG